MIIKENETSLVDFDLLDFLRNKKEFLKEEYQADLKKYIWGAVSALKRKRALQYRIYLDLITGMMDKSGEYTPAASLEYRRVCRAIREVEDILNIRKASPDDVDFDSAKQYPIETLFHEYGHQVKRHACLCPFHSEDTPSCHIYKNTNSFYCHGCGVGGSPIDFIMRTDGISAKQAALLLSSM